MYNLNVTMEQCDNNKPQYTNAQMFEVIKMKNTFFFSKDALNSSKVSVKTFDMLQMIYVFNKLCSYKCYIHQRILKKIFGT